MATDTVTKKDWTQHKIKDFGVVSTGTTPSTKKKEYYGGKYKLISPADLTDSKYIFTSHKLITDEGLKVSRTLPRNSVLVGCIGNVGKIGMTIDEVSAFNQQINAVTCNDNFNADFVYYLLRENRALLESKSAKVTLPILNKSNFENIDFDVPKLPEQKAIAQTLTTVQDAIAEQEKLIAKLKELKRSMMQQLFTHGTKGEKTKMTEIGEVPETWKVVRMDALCKTEMRNGAFARRSQFGSGYLFANVVDMYGALHLSYVKLDRVDISHKEMARFALNDGDLLFVRSSLKRDGVAQCSVVRNLPEVAVYDCHLIKAEIDNSLAIPEFVANYWRSDLGKRELVQRSKTTTMTTINQDGLGAALLPLPCLDEQEKITNILQSVDDRVQALQNKLFSYHDLFKTLLHELMSGERRIKNI